MNDKLRKLILENPDLPIIISCGEEANTGEWLYECHFDYSCDIVECTWFKGKFFDDKDELLEYIAEITINSKTYISLNDKERKEWSEKYLEEHNIKFEKYINISVG